MLESSRWRLQLCFNFTSIGGLHTKLWASKITRVLILKISGLPMGVSKQNDIWVLALWPNIENIIRGKVVASPKSRPWWVLWEFVFACDLSMHLKCFNYVVTNLLFSLCMFMWVINLLVNLLSPHPGAPTRPYGWMW
jgi:hypothetical protein